MCEANLEPDVFSYSAGISACKNCGQWQRALSLFDDMCEARVERDAISYNAGISACEQGEQWQRALSLFCELWQVRLEPNAITTTRGSARAGRASSGSGPQPCSAKCGRPG
ncbi:unnamed protein product [Prorocentrum cordatum]|uniref:Uncharacterized protein n=1 Tax=Prorocentrum cordatum TaxID=2364126 RepID=A0ABN9TMJ6_9DINO|nr:unnamed protein product [Polarella glacialis]